MKKISSFIVRFRFWLLGLFLILVGVSLFLMQQVNINYNLMQYLDKNSTSTVALETMEDEFGSVGQCQVLVTNVEFENAKEIKTKIEEVDGVASVIFASKETDTEYYNTETKDALYKVFLTTSNFDTASYKTLDRIRDTLNDYTIHLNGGSVESQFLTESLDKDMVIILIIVIVVVFGILMLTSSSYAEPFIFLIVAGGAILINMGTNILLNAIPYIGNSMSFVTKSIAAVMQLALSMDYSIVLLHAYKEEKEKCDNNHDAMINALTRSFAPVSASSITTIAGLIALMFMSFSIGFDVGLVLAKGILLSLLSVFLFMPALLLLFDKVLVKTAHKPVDKILIGKIKEHKAKKAEEGKKTHSFAGFQNKTKIIIPVLALIVIGVGAVLNFKTDYSFTLKASTDDNSSVNVDDRYISDEFGTQNTLVVLIEKNEKTKAELENEENEIVDYLKNYKYKDEKVINSAQGYSSYGVYDDLTAEEFADKFLDQSTKGANVRGIETLYKYLLAAGVENKGTEENPKFNVYDVIKFAANNEGAKKITEASQALIDKLNSVYNTKLTAEQFANNYLDAETMGANVRGASTLYNYLLGAGIAHTDDNDNIVCTAYDVIKYAVENEGAKKITEASQALIDTVYGVYVTELTAEQFAIVNSLNKSIVEKVFTAMGVEKATTYDVLKFVKDANFATNAMNALQQTINASYNDLVTNNVFNSNGSVNTETVNNMKAFCAGYESGVIENNAENTVKYEAYKKIIAEFTKDELMAQYPFITSDTADVLLNGNTTIPNYMVIQAVAANNIASQYGAGLQHAINAKYAEIPAKDQVLTINEIVYNYAVDANTIQALAASGDITNLKLFKTLSEAQYYKNAAYQAAMQAKFDASFATIPAKNQVLTKDQIIYNYAVDDDTINELLNNGDITNAKLFTKLSQEQYFVDEDYQNELQDKFNTSYDAFNNFESDNYIRVIFNFNLPRSGDDSFKAINEISDHLYGEYNDVKLVSESYVYSQIKDVYNKDIVVVNLISFIAILLIIAITFKSYFVPILLTILIQGAIWVTMGISTMFGSEIFFICYIVVMCVQMGATIDYGILLTNNYIQARKKMNVVDSMKSAMASSITTILTSGSILVLATLIIGLVSRVSIVSDLGLLLSRGCLISVIMIILCLPQFLMLTDKLIEKTSFGVKFYKGENEVENQATLNEEVLIEDNQTEQVEVEGKVEEVKENE